VIADSTEEVGQRNGGELRKTFAFLLFSLRCRMNEVKRQLVEQDQDALAFEDGGPLFFRGRGVRCEIGVEFLADADPNIFIRGSAGKGDDFVRIDDFWRLLEWLRLGELRETG